MNPPDRYHTGIPNNQQNEAYQPIEHPEDNRGVFDEIMTFLHGNQIPDSTMEHYELTPSNIPNRVQGQEEINSSSFQQAHQSENIQSQNVSNKGVTASTESTPQQPGSNAILIPILWCGTCINSFPEPDFIRSHNHRQ